MVMTKWFLLAVTIFVPFFVHGNDESMGRLARPKVFINIEELKEYLDVVKEYYNINAKGRYGKRSGNVHNFLDFSKHRQNSLLSKVDTLESNYRHVETSSVDSQPRKLQRQLHRLQARQLSDKN